MSSGSCRAPLSAAAVSMSSTRFVCPARTSTPLAICIAGPRCPTTVIERTSWRSPRSWSSTARRFTKQRTRVAIGDGRIVGFATTRAVADTLELDDLFVDPEWMRRGVGSDLIERRRRDRAMPVASLESRSRQTGTRLEFYEAAGFVVDGLTETRFGSACRMHLDVAAPRRLIDATAPRSRCVEKCGSANRAVEHAVREPFVPS